jgi:hypothetical protein
MIFLLKFESYYIKLLQGYAYYINEISSHTQSLNLVQLYNILVKFGNY